MPRKAKEGNRSEVIQDALRKNGRDLSGMAMEKNKEKNIIEGG